MPSRVIFAIVPNYALFFLPVLCCFPFRDYVPSGVTRGFGLYISLFLSVYFSFLPRCSFLIHASFHFASLLSPFALFVLSLFGVSLILSFGFLVLFCVLLCFVSVRYIRFCSINFCRFLCSLSAKPREAISTPGFSGVFLILV